MTEEQLRESGKAAESAGKARDKRLRQEAAGIPDSRPFVAPEADRQSSGEDRILSCHINGVLVRDMHLDPQVIAALDYWQSDEGVAEKNANPQARPGSGITLGAGPFEKALQQKRHEVKDRDFPNYVARDPFREVAEKHARPGMRPKMLSGSSVKNGSPDPDYEIVKDASGDPVKVKGMVLGHIPEELAQARERHYAARGNQILKQIGEQYQREGGATAVSDQ